MHPSSEMKKIVVPPSESIVPSSEFFRNGVVFFLMTVLSTPFYHFLFQKKGLPAVFELDQAMWDSVRTPKHNTGLGVHET